MTKEQAVELKRLINQDKRYPTYYSSKAQTMSARVYTYTNNAYDAEAERNAIDELLAKVPGAPYEIKRRTYQGFIHDTDIIFK